MSLIWVFSIHRGLASNSRVDDGWIVLDFLGMLSSELSFFNRLHGLAEALYCLVESSSIAGAIARD